MQASIYCTKCKAKSEVKASEVIFLFSNASTYVCKACKVVVK